MSRKLRTESLIERLASDATLDAAYDWLCRQRRNQGPNRSVWDLRFHWPTVKARLRSELREGSFLFGPTRIVIDAAGERRELREAIDALVTRALAQILKPVLSPHIPVCCTHIAGHGGHKGALRQILRALPHFRFAFKTDIWRYYASIDPVEVMAQISRLGVEPAITRLVWQAMRRTTWDNGAYRIEARGIALGCSLSPLLAGLYLADLDRALMRENRFYIRFMDDLLILTSSKYRLRDTIKQVRSLCRRLRLRLHPDKTWMGRIERGFDFLGVRFDVNSRDMGGDTRSVSPGEVPDPLISDCIPGAPQSSYRIVWGALRISPSQRCLAWYRRDCRRLNEQRAPMARRADYRTRWLRWFWSGLGPSVVA